MYAGGLTKFEPREMERIPVPQPTVLAGDGGLKPPPTWSDQELETASTRAEEHFREGRHTEPLERYLELFDEYRGVVEEVLEQTVDLSQVRTQALSLNVLRARALRWLTLKAEGLTNGEVNNTLWKELVATRKDCAGRAEARTKPARTTTGAHSGTTANAGAPSATLAQAPPTRTGTQRSNDASAEGRHEERSV